MWALLPVKAPALSKTRLLSVLLEEECAALSWAMLKDMLAALDAAEEIDTITLLTKDPAVIKYGLKHGYKIIKEEPGAGLNASIDAAAAELTDAGIDKLLIIPADLPTVRASDIDQLCRLHRGALTLCPAVRDGGTNALVSAPPNAVATQFGPDSARRFAKEARNNGLRAARADLPAFERDIDRPDDLVWLLEQQGMTHTKAYLAESGIADRLQHPPKGAIA